MALLIKNGGYALLIRVDVMFSMSWKDFQLLQMKCEILIIDTWNEYIKKSAGMVNLFFYSEFNVRMPISLKQ